MVTFELQAMRGMPGSSGIMKYSHSTIDTSKRYVLVVEDSKMI